MNGVCQHSNLESRTTQSAVTTKFPSLFNIWHTKAFVLVYEHGWEYKTLCRLNWETKDFTYKDSCNKPDSCLKNQNLNAMTSYLKQNKPWSRTSAIVLLALEIKSPLES